MMLETQHPTKPHSSLHQADRPLLRRKVVSCNLGTLGYALRAVVGVPVLSRKRESTLSRGGVMVEAQHPTEPQSSLHRPTGRD